MKKKLGEILLEKGYITEEDLNAALSIQENYGAKIGTILLNMGVITEEQLIEALSIQFDLPFLKKLDNLDFQDIGISPNLLIENLIFPFKEDKEYIYLLTNDPLKTEIFPFIQNTKHKQVKIYLTIEDNIKPLLSLIEGTVLTETEKNEGRVYEDEIEKLKELASETPVIKLINSLLSKAIEKNASDIHFESFKNFMKVRFRIDGVLIPTETIPNSLKLPVITRLKLISGMNIAESRLPQDGRISLKIAGKDIDIRASSVPTQFGESFVLRLLKKDSVNYSLESLGFYQDHIDLIKSIVSKSNGIFLTTGPTGSGKTTTLYSILNWLNNERVKIITVEDPVEYELKGINQIQVNPDIDYTFAKALRSILRQDPDIIMVGEIRDVETAEIAIQAALTGHLVLSTLHTNNALASISRLLDMGVEFFLIKASIVGLMAQRLVRTLCPYCSEETDFTPEQEHLYKINQLIEKYNVKYSPKKAVGCEHCNYTGYKGRTVIAEVVPFDITVIKEFEKDKSFNDISKLGYRSIFEDGLLKIIEGKTTIDEVLRVVA